MPGTGGQALWLAGLVALGAGGCEAPDPVRAGRQALDRGEPDRGPHGDGDGDQEPGHGGLALSVSPAPVLAGEPFEVTVSGLGGRERHQEDGPRVTLRLSAGDLGPLHARARGGLAVFPRLRTCAAGELTAVASAGEARGEVRFPVLPGPAARVATAGDGQRGPVAAALPLPLSVAVRDRCGNPVPGLEVRWSGSGAEPAPATSVTDATGTASTLATLGTRAGPVTLTAAVPGVPPVTFRAEALAGAFEVLAFRHLPEVVLAGQRLEPPLEVALVDAFGNPTLSGGVEVTLGLLRDGVLFPGGLLGTTTVKAQGGFARFVDVTIRDPGGNLALVATAGELRSESPPFLAQCVRGTTDCGGQCVDLAGSDPANCGACGQACTPGDECSAGACRTPFRVVATVPAADASGLLPTQLTEVELQFTTAVDVTSLEANLAVTISSGALPPLTTRVVGGNRVLLQALRPRWPAGATVTVELGAALRGTSGLPLGAPYAWSFQFLPLEGLPFLSKPGIGSPEDSAAYYALQPLRTDCDWWGSEIGWQCYQYGAPPSFDSWVASFTWLDQTPPPDTLGPPVVFFNADDLSLARKVYCGSLQGTVNPGVFCAVVNHGLPPGVTSPPDPGLALEQALTGQQFLSISTISRTLDPDLEHRTQTLVQPQPYVSRPLWAVRAGDVLSLEPASGSIWAGNIFFGHFGPEGAGVPCRSNLFDTCPLEGAPLFGLLIDLPAGTTAGGIDMGGRHFLGSRALTLKVSSPGTVSFLINDPAASTVGDGAFTWESTLRRANNVTFQVYSPFGYDLLSATTLDSQGSKQVPQACLACHGGRWDPETRTISGASFLPFDVGRLAFSTNPRFTRGAQEARLRDLNLLVMSTGPNGGRPDGPINSWIRGTYAHGLPADDTYTPPGWANDVRLYQRVVRPYCQVCHQAMEGALDFTTAAGFRALTGAIRQDVCVSHTMPHAEPTFVGFWQSGAQRVLSEELLGGAPCEP